MMTSDEAREHFSLRQNETAVRKRWRLLGWLATNVGLALLWARFALNAYNQWAQTGSIVMLGLVLYNTVLVSVTITRRPSVSTSSEIKDWVVAIVAVVLSLVFQPAEWRHPFAQAVGSTLQALGLIIMVIALVNLGRSFGIVPANRGIKRSGLYGWVRHPLYAGEIVLFTGFLLTSFSPHNLAVWFGVLCGLFIRSWMEEDHLSHDLEYQAYRKAVPYGFFPGVF